MHNFPKILYENKRHFSKLSNINLISNFKQNLIEDFISRTNVLIQMLCLQKNRRDQRRFYKQRIERLKRVKDIIQHKECQKSARIKQMLKNARFSLNLYLFHTP